MDIYTVFAYIMMIIKTLETYLRKFLSVIEITTPSTVTG